MTKKIYLSPSDQINNAYAYGKTNEAVQCRKIAAACKAALERNGFEVRMNTEDGSEAMYKRVRESNAFGADMHICIHTNAGGGKGAEIYISSKTEDRLKAANAVYDAVRAISLYGSSRGIKTANFYEIKNTTAMCLYLEADFHDNAKIAEWIVNSTDKIGEAICKGVCQYYGVKYDGEAQETVRQNEILLPTLRLGSRGAEVKTLQRLLKALGYKTPDGNTLSVDGSFGPDTEYAVRRWQTAKLNGADGIVGIKTWTKLLKD